jgi:hypothetical protein
MTGKKRFFRGLCGKNSLEGKKCRRGKNYLSPENTRVYENGKNSPDVFPRK